jgi:hypothetical protein
MVNRAKLDGNPQGTSIALGLMEAVEETLMIEPPLGCLAICVPKRAERRNGPFKLRPTT